jgi:hypothetical protein
VRWFDYYPHLDPVDQGIPDYIKLYPSQHNRDPHDHDDVPHDHDDDDIQLNALQ